MNTTNNHNHLIIFTYHAVIRSPLEVFDWCFLDEKIFRRQMIFIKKHFDVVSFSEAIKRLSSGKKYPLMAAITFDDGFQNNYDIAFPVLRELQIPAIIFPVTGLINTGQIPWFCRINRALTLTGRSSLRWDGRHYPVSNKKQKAKTSAKIQHRLKRLKNPVFRDEVRKIVQELGDDPDAVVKINSPYRMLSRDAIVDMITSGLIEFGGHTHNHVILSYLTPGEQEREISASVTRIQELTGRTCHFFAYPNGRRQDFTAETIQILRKYGITASVTTMKGFNDKKTPLMELRRNEYSSLRKAVLLPFYTFCYKVLHNGVYPLNKASDNC